jgi:RNA polymerase sigma-70 factor, ECF subfamily
MDEMPVDALTLRPPGPSSAATGEREHRRRADRSERRLAARLRAGDPNAIEDAYRAYGAATFGFLVRLLGDRAAAEDVQQQVFTEVWRRAGDYDPRRAGLLTWVLTIARSRAIDHLRRRVPEPRDPQLPDTRTVPAGVDALLERWRLAHLLGRLPENERALLRMRFYEELSQSEIAERIGISQMHVSRLLRRSFEQMRRRAQPDDDPDA